MYNSIWLGLILITAHLFGHHIEKEILKPWKRRRKEQPKVARKTPLQSSFSYILGTDISSCSYFLDQLLQSVTMPSLCYVQSCTESHRTDITEYQKITMYMY